MARVVVAMVAVVTLCGAATGAGPGPQLRVSDQGMVLRCGEPYRGIGINYFSAFVRALHDPTDRSYDDGLRVLAEHEIPFARFMACGFWPNDFARYREDKEGYFQTMDAVVASAESHGIGLIPSLFWFIAAVPDLVGEPVSAWGDGESKTRDFMRTYTREVVMRYNDSPTIWAWEFGNEYNLAADLPGEHYPNVAPRLGTPESRSAADKVSSAMVEDALRDFAETVRECDPVRPITSGHSVPRPSAWHLERDGTWDIDTREQFAENLSTRVPEPIDMISVHVYPHDELKRFGGTHPEDILRLVTNAAREHGHAVFVGEFGAADDEEHGGPERARREILDQLAAIERTGVDLAALWVFDLPQQEDTHNITIDNHRRGLLGLLRDANRRLAALRSGTHAADLVNDGWSGRLYDNAGNNSRQGSGFNPLWHRAFPGESLFRLDAVGLNFEHIFDGSAKHKDIAMFTPRNDTVRLEIHSPVSATLHWPAENSAWGMECSMRYTLSDGNAIDMEFTAIPRREQFDLGYVAMMWASYMNHTRGREIHFYGTNSGEEGWVAFGEDTADGFETGTVACAGVADLPYEAQAQTLNLIEHPTKKFELPFYYGMVDGDGDDSTQDDTMAYMMMFDQREPIRFAMWNFFKGADGTPDAHSPAWDWQYVIRDPKIGETYGYRARTVFVPFTDREQLKSIYSGWAASLTR